MSSRSRIGDADDLGPVNVGVRDLVGYTQSGLRASRPPGSPNAFEQEAHELITRGRGAGSSRASAMRSSSAPPRPGPRPRSPSTSPTSSRPTPRLTSLRSGLASGEVLSRDGDLYGSVVNIVARVVKEIDPGTVVSDRPIEGFTSSPIGVAELRGVGEPTQLFVIDRGR